MEEVKKFWHEAKEKPRVGAWILIERDPFGGFSRVVEVITAGKAELLDWVKTTVRRWGIRRWAYIDDLPDE